MKNFSTKEFKDFMADFSGEILFDEPMCNHTSWKIGGKADCFVVPKTVDDIAAVLVFCNTENIPLTIIGRGTNLLVSDDGIAGIVMQISDNFNKIIWLNSTEVRAEAGCLLATLSRDAAKNSCTGLEWACGIPGNVGGAVMMNAGAYGSNISNYITEIEIVELAGKEPQLKVLTKNDLDFSYRHSGINNNQVVVGVNFLLEPGDKERSEAEMKELLQTRAAKQPLEYPSAGSVFKNPEGDHAGRLVEVSGCRGLTCGGAQVSQKHGNFIVNLGGAKAADVLNLIEQVQNVVYEKQGVKLEPEVRKIGRF
jgi:UDP-N-acetylmuramate dehydrogenase